MEMSEFEKASRLKLRFDTSKGLLSTEDLWDLPLTSLRSLSLDDVAKGLYRQLQELQTPSFVNAKDNRDTVTQLRFDIVQRVIKIRVAELAKADEQRIKQEKKQQILALISQKESEQLAGQSLEDLRKLVDLFDVKDS